MGDEGLRERREDAEFLSEMWSAVRETLPDREEVMPAVCLMRINCNFEEPVCIHHAPEAIRGYLESEQDIVILLMHPEDRVPCTSCLAEACRADLH